MLLGIAGKSATPQYHQHFSSVSFESTRTHCPPIGCDINVTICRSTGDYARYSRLVEILFCHQIRCRFHEEWQAICSRRHLRQLCSSPIQVSNAPLIYSHENVLAGVRDLTTTVGITQIIVNSTIPPPDYISIIGTLDVPTAQVLQSPGNGSWVEN
jgi:hypothetical protein